MTIKRVKAAADARGIYFNGVKQWINNFIGYGYYFYGPGGGLYQSDNLSGIYSFIMKYPKTSTI